MKITYQGVDYPIVYQHNRIIKDGKVQAKGGTTVAYIYDKTTGNIIHLAKANVSNKDTYRKKLGRIIATGRLLKGLGLPRTEMNI